MTPRKKIKHCVVLLNYQDASTTATCVRSIERTKDTPYIIVVDNGSDPACLRQLRDLCPGVEIIPSDHNLGFSAGNNLGIKKALRLGAEVIYLLNNDTTVDPNLFFRAYRYVAKKNRIAGAKIYYAKGFEYHSSQKGQGNILWYAGGYFDYSQAISRHYGVDEADHGQYDQSRSVDFITGCFLAVPRSVFKKIGLLDEPFFLYLEDTDFCLRAQAAHVEVMYNPRLILSHFNGASTGAGSSLADYYLTRNRFFLAKRYGSLRLRFALAREALFRNWHNPVRRLAYLDYLRGRMGNRNHAVAHIKDESQP